MLIHREIRERIINYLEADLPVRIGRWNKAEKMNVSVPVTYDGFDPTSVNHDSYPAIGLYINSSNAHRRVDVNETGGSEIHATFGIVISVAASNRYLGLDEEGVDSWEHPGRNYAMDNCRDLCGIVMQAIFDNPAFNIDRRESDDTVVLVDSSVNVNYADPIQPSPERTPVWVAAAQISLQVTAAESIRRPTYGVVRTVHAEAKVILDEGLQHN